MVCIGVVASEPQDTATVEVDQEGLVGWRPPGGRL